MLFPLIPLSNIASEFAGCILVRAWCYLILLVALRVIVEDFGEGAEIEVLEAQEGIVLGEHAFCLRPGDCEVETAVEGGGRSVCYLVVVIANSGSNTAQNFSHALADFRFELVSNGFAAA